MDLRRLFGSRTRAKLLSLFLSDPNREFFVRELTRVLDEQINSIRREVDNLKGLGLLRSRTKNRKKYFFVNKNFILLEELRGIIIKSRTSESTLVKDICALGETSLILASGSLVEHQNSPVDLFIVGKIPREKLSLLISSLERENRNEIRFVLLSPEDFEYRRNYNDKFVSEILADPQNLVLFEQ